MTAQPAVRSVVSLHNRLIRLGYDDGREIGQIMWDLRKLAHQTQSDFDVRVTLADACARLGQREDAIREAKAAFGLRYTAQQGVTDLVTVLSGLGMVAEASAAAHMLMERAGFIKLEPSVSAVLLAAVCAGDVERLTTLVDALDDQDSPSAIALDAIKDAGLLEHLSAHQSIVNDILKDVRCIVKLHIDITGETAIALRYRVLGGTEDQLDMRRQMANALREYYSRQGFKSPPYLGRFTAVVSGVCTQEAVVTA
jgi:hypothetical protein